MIPRWATLKESDRALFRAATAFLIGRLDERTTIDWALGLKSEDRVKRAALLDLVDGAAGGKIGEPWLAAWRLIEESWDSPVIESRASSSAIHIAQKVNAGDRSGALVSEITELVTPRVEVKPISQWQLQNSRPPKRPRAVEHLLSAGITSGEVIDPKALGLIAVDNVQFLVGLGHSLDAAVIGGLDVARRTGWDGKSRLWQLGQLNRVYYVPEEARPAEEHEPDEFHRGIAPSVKLLHFVVSRIVDLDKNAAIEFVLRWRQLQSPIHTRLWASLSRDPRVMPANDVATFLLSLDDRYFWDQNANPEIAELRAIRFKEFASVDQLAIVSRLKKLPPRNQWPKKVEDYRVKEARLYWVVRELRRIEVAGATLPSTTRKWLATQIGKFPGLSNMSRIDEGFMGTSKARSIGSGPDNRYDLLVGNDRLEALETSLSSQRGGWDDDPAERAASWMRQPGNPTRIIEDFESTSDEGVAYPVVWERFGWAHSPAPEQNADDAQHNLSQAARVISLLVKLPDETARKAINGISNWVSVWEKRLVSFPDGLTIWFKLWPIAAEATNAVAPVEDQFDLQTVARSTGGHEPMDLDTLNTSAGKLVGVFLASCPAIKGEERPFETNNLLTAMRDEIIDATGRAGLIGRHRLIESLPYFLRADRSWTENHLIKPLVADNVEALALWRAIARQTHFTDALKIIGGPMAERATDNRLGRETRRSLVFSLVVECLHALNEERGPAVPYARIQQMIRSLDEEVRADGAGAIQRFIQDVSAKTEWRPTPQSREELFQKAAKPFLQHVWPQERSLSTPGISKALADLPATAREAFAEAVDAIERFLMPFECWSMLDYGFYGEEDGEAKLSKIDGEEKAAAFLRLLDRTIGDAETSIVPMDLGDALDQIRKVAPNLAESQSFRRLATAARRA